MSEQREETEEEVPVVLREFLYTKGRKLKLAGFALCICDNHMPCAGAGDLSPAKGIEPARLTCKHRGQDVLAVDVSGCEHKQARNVPPLNKKK